jgi:hypothetical protein
MPSITIRRLAILLIGIAATSLVSCSSRPRTPSAPSLPHIEVQHCADFDVTGDGSSPAWEHAEWHEIKRIGEGLDYSARFKILYSKTGLYVFMDGSDTKLTCTHEADGLPLFLEDVVEFFVKPDDGVECYLEYEISPLGYHLLARIAGKSDPWHDRGKKNVRRATSVLGGEKRPGASVEQWRAEVFVPFDLIQHLPDEPPPAPGTRWRANFYRIDYDVSDGVDPDSITYWTWAPLVGGFHQPEKFGVLIFGERTVSGK